MSRLLPPYQIPQQRRPSHAAFVEPIRREVDGWRAPDVGNDWTLALGAGVERGLGRRRSGQRPDHSSYHRFPAASHGLLTDILVWPHPELDALGRPFAHILRAESRLCALEPPCS